MLEIVRFILGPVATNAYLVADTETNEAVVIDPAWDGHVISSEAQKRGWKIGQIWYTHAHFDHFGGAAELVRDPSTGLGAGLQPAPRIALHASDLPVWEACGGAPAFGFEIDPGPRPDVDLSKVRLLSVGAYRFNVRHAPGHSPGLCIFYCAEARTEQGRSAGVLFSGDLIFQRGVGRTDLPGGDETALLTSIQQQVYTLPDATRILSGHGEETTVGEEKCENPFIRA
jgi:glyoxylase-like metal-dependent hydrolase (beta-lactamase superfamily II)